MSETIVVSALGRDRTGLINHLTHTIKQAGGNVETQRSARMASDFAVIVLFSVPAGQSAQAMESLQALQDDFYFIQARPAEPGDDHAAAGLRSTELIASGADQPGILDEVTQILMERSINVESLNYDTESAPMTGHPLFRMRARITLPEHIDTDALRSAFRELEDEFNFDILLQQY